jgi:hypothetical protein
MATRAFYVVCICAPLASQHFTHHLDSWKKSVFEHMRLGPGPPQKKRDLDLVHILCVWARWLFYMFVYVLSLCIYMYMYIYIYIYIYTLSPRSKVLVQALAIAFLACSRSVARGAIAIVMGDSSCALEERLLALRAAASEAIPRRRRGALCRAWRRRWRMHCSESPRRAPLVHALVIRAPWQRSLRVPRAAGGGGGSELASTRARWGQRRWRNCSPSCS